MFKFLETQKFPVILLALGVLLILAGFFELKDLTKLQISAYPNPHYLIVSLGFVFSVFSTFLYLFDEMTFGWVRFRRINKLDNGISTRLSNTNINIQFGQLEKLAEASKESLVVLPANEFFDDACINDKMTALGAYVNDRFTNQTEEVKKYIHKGLDGLGYQEVEKETGVFQNSYGIGVGVFVNELLSSKQPLLFVSVTTKRAGQGLRADMSYIFKAVGEIERTMVDKRITSVYLPIMGAGKGGLRKEVALFGILLAICDVVTKPDGHNIENFNIVVFQQANTDKPSIPKAVSKRLLRIATGMYS